MVGHVAYTLQLTGICVRYSPSQPHHPLQECELASGYQHLHGMLNSMGPPPTYPLSSQELSTHWPLHSSFPSAAPHMHIPTTPPPMPTALQEFDLSDGNPHPRDTHWRGPAPPGSFSLPNTYAQRTRLTPLAVPEPGAGGSGAAAGAGPNPLRQLLAPLRREEYYGVEMELDYGREWPR